MTSVSQALRRLYRNDDGQDLVEYGLLSMLIAVGAVLAVNTLGNTINVVMWEVIAASI